MLVTTIFVHLEFFFQKKKDKIFSKKGPKDKLLF